MSQLGLILDALGIEDEKQIPPELYPTYSRDKVDVAKLYPNTDRLNLVTNLIDVDGRVIRVGDQLRGLKCEDRRLGVRHTRLDQKIASSGIVCINDVLATTDEIRSVFKERGVALRLAMMEPDEYKGFGIVLILCTPDIETLHRLINERCHIYYANHFFY